MGPWDHAETVPSDAFIKAPPKKLTDRSVTIVPSHDAGKESAPYPVVPITAFIALLESIATRVCPAQEIYFTPVRAAKPVMPNDVVKLCSPQHVTVPIDLTEQQKLSPQHIGDR